MKREATASVTIGGNRYTLAEALKIAGLKRKKPKAVRPPPAHEPHACVVLAVDTARNSGMAVYLRGRYIASGEVRKDDDAGLLAWCVDALRLAIENAVPCVLVLEKPPAFVYRGRSASTMVGLGAARQAWERGWRDAGGIKARVVRVEPATWRKPVLGVTKGPDLPSVERARARALSGKVDIGSDEAAAVGVGYWASLAGEVLESLPAKHRVAAVGSTDRTPRGPEPERPTRGVPGAGLPAKEQALIDRQRNFDRALGNKRARRKLRATLPFAAKDR